jgi:metal-responsive CopG/Arc/MetJ family transcriptional regulator
MAKNQVSIRIEGELLEQVNEESRRRGMSRSEFLEIAAFREILEDFITIYALLDPRDGRQRYVGQTRNPTRRLQTHIAEAKTMQGSRKNAWIRELLESDLRPELLVLEEVEPVHADTRERYWIQRIGDLNANLPVGLTHRGHEQREQLKISIPPDLVRVIDGYRAISGESRSKLVERALKLFLDTEYAQIQEDPAAIIRRVRENVQIDQQGRGIGI